MKIKGGFLKISADAQADVDLEDSLIFYGLDRSVVHGGELPDVFKPDQIALGDRNSISLGPVSLQQENLIPGGFNSKVYRIGWVSVFFNIRSKIIHDPAKGPDI